jgi:hypothetical protein
VLLRERGARVLLPCLPCAELNVKIDWHMGVRGSQAANDDVGVATAAAATATATATTAAAAAAAAADAEAQAQPPVRPLPGALLAAVPISAWPKCDVHDAAFLERLRDAPGRLAVVGIHLCKMLSPRCVGVFNCLGAAKAPFLLLAPCCMPKVRGAPELRCSITAL